jgi:hypothetical protein
MFKQYRPKSIFIAVWGELAEDWRKLCNELDESFLYQMLWGLSRQGEWGGEGRGKSWGPCVVLVGNWEERATWEELDLDGELY